MIALLVIFVFLSCQKMVIAMVDDLGMATDIPIIVTPTINRTTTVKPPPQVNTTIHNNTTISNNINPIVPPTPVAWTLQTPSEGQTILLQEETSSLFSASPLGYDTTHAVIQFPFNQSLAIASFPPLLTTTSLSGTTNINPTSHRTGPMIENLPITSNDFLINDVSFHPRIDTLFVTNSYGIYTLVDNYRGTLSSLPVGTPKGVTQVLTYLLPHPCYIHPPAAYSFPSVDYWSI